MKNFKYLAGAFLQDESGQDLIEYALVAGLIGLGAIAAIGALGTAVSSAFNNVTSGLKNAA